MELTRKQEMQAYTDALVAIVVALGFQIDPLRLRVDLQAIAKQAERAGNRPSAGLIDQLIGELTHVHLTERPKH